MKLFNKVAAAVALATLPVLPLAAQAKQVSLDGSVKAVKVVTDAAGKETTKLVEPTQITPGDRLIFGTDYSNNGAEPATNFTVTNAVPSAVRVAPDADPALIVSVDSGKTWGEIASLTVVSQDGSTRAATHGDVTHVRWTFETIAPGASGRVEYPAIIR
ncbi:MAG: hypothetical protein AAF687_06665 [Pseudomonadota bacterium]